MGVFFLSDVSSKDLKVIQFQLDREPTNLGGITRYCPFDKPAVLLTLPYHLHKGIFPTTYWLSCPFLVKEVSRLEEKGMVSELTAELDHNPLLRKKMMKAHQRYTEKRISLLSDKELSLLKREPEGIMEVLEESGIGGIRDFRGVKCLHTHLADFLGGGQNPIGEMVWQRVSWPDACNICELDGDD